MTHDPLLLWPVDPMDLIALSVSAPHRCGVTTSVDHIPGVPEEPGSVDDPRVTLPGASSSEVEVIPCR